MLKQQLRELMG